MIIENSKVFTLLFGEKIYLKDILKIRIGYSHNHYYIFCHGISNYFREVNDPYPFFCWTQSFVKKSERDKAVNKLIKKLKQFSYPEWANYIQGQLKGKMTKECLKRLGWEINENEFQILPPYWDFEKSIVAPKQ